MKIHIEHLILLIGLLVSTTISITEKPIITVYESYGNYYDLNGNLVENINPDQLKPSGTLHVDFSGTSYEMYTTYTLAGRISIWTLTGSIIISCIIYVFNKWGFFNKDD